MYLTHKEVEVTGQARGSVVPHHAVVIVAAGSCFHDYLCP